MRTWIIIGIIGILFFIPAIVEVFGQEYSRDIRGQNFILSESLIDGQIKGTWTSVPEWIYDGANFQPFIYNEDGNIIQIETAHGSVILDKNTCGYSFFKKGHISPGDEALFSDSIIARMATNGTDIWSEINSINNAACQASWDGQTLIARKQSGAGILDYKFIDMGTKWKTQLEATNLSAQTDKKFGFTQTINLNKDTVFFGGQERNLDNFDGTTFDRTFLENNESKVIDFLTGAYFDFDISFDNLWAVAVYDTGTNSSKLAFDFTNNAPVILPSETLIIDPTFGYSSGTAYEIRTNNASGAACPSVSGFTGTSIRKAPTGSSDYCELQSTEWDISSIPDTAQIDDANLKVNVTLTSNAINCDVTQMDLQPSANTAANVWLDILNGTQYVDNNSFCTTVADNVIVSLSSAISDIESQLADDWFAVGFKFDSMTRDGSDHQVDVTSGPEPAQLEIDYTVPVGSISDLACTFDDTINDYGVDCTWSAPAGTGISGYQILRDVGGGLEVLVNDTGTTSTTYRDDLDENLGGFSISMWAKYSNSGTQALLTKDLGAGGASSPGYSIFNSGANNLLFRIQDGSSTHDVGVAGSANDGEWHHIGGTYAGYIDANKDQMKSYYDGAYVATGTSASINSFLNDDNLAIGAEWDGGLPFTGVIDEVFIYDIVLTDDEMESLFNGESVGSPIASYTFENNLNDGSGNGNDGTMTGTETYVTGQSGNAISFDGASYANVLNPANFDFHYSLWHEYDVRGWGTLGLGTVSNLQNVTTIDPVNAAITTHDGVIGNVLGANYTATVSGFPIHEATQVRTIINGSATDTTTLSDFTDSLGNMTDWMIIGEGITEVIHELTVRNATDNTIAFNSTQNDQTKEYEPDYFTATVSSQGLVNYTQNRLNDQDTVQLKINRDKSGAVFQTECLFQTPSQAQFDRDNGTWVNMTNQGWYNGTVSGFSGTHAYISCYNDDLLFSTVSYTNSSLALSGIQAFDDIYAGFIGVPVGIFFLVIVAGYANPRTAPIWLVVVLGMAAILSQTGYITLSTEIWALMIVAGIFGLFVGRKFF